VAELTYGQAVRRLRIARGLSQEALAGEVGLSAAQLERIERGRSTAGEARQERLTAALKFYGRRDEQDGLLVAHFGFRTAFTTRSVRLSA